MAKQKKVKEKVVVKPLQDPKQDCPKGYYWNGTKCVLDVG